LGAATARHATADLRHRALDKPAGIDRTIARLNTIRAALALAAESNCDSLTSYTCSHRPIPFTESPTQRRPQ
jgi:hypothetical protein